MYVYLYTDQGGGSPKNIGVAAGRERARSCAKPAKHGTASSAGVLAARVSYSHAHLFCVLSQGFPSKRETARPLYFNKHRSFSLVFF